MTNVKYIVIVCIYNIIIFVKFFYNYTVTVINNKYYNDLYYLSVMAIFSLATI